MVLALLSSVSLAFVTLLIFTDKRIQGHPNMLIAYTCLADSFNFFNFFLRYVTCGYNLNIYLDQLFAITVQIPYIKIKSMLTDPSLFQRQMDFYATN